MAASREGVTAMNWQFLDLRQKNETTGQGRDGERAPTVVRGDLALRSSECYRFGIFIVIFKRKRNARKHNASWPDPIINSISIIGEKKKCTLFVWLHCFLLDAYTYSVLRIRRTKMNETPRRPRR